MVCYISSKRYNRFVTKRKLYLASSIDRTAESIAKDIGKNPKKLKLVFIPTAAEVEPGNLDWMYADRKGLVDAGFNVFNYTITGRKHKDLERDLKEADIVHVNGGNSFYFIIQARKSGFGKWVKKAVDKGKIYIGSSAGSMVASPDIGIAKSIETGMYAKKLRSHKAFGLVDFITLPHWGSKYFKKMYLRQRLNIAYKPENKIILLNDWQYVKVENDMYKIIDVRDKKKK